MSIECQMFFILMFGLSISVTQNFLFVGVLFIQFGNEMLVVDCSHLSQHVGEQYGS